MLTGLEWEGDPSKGSQGLGVSLEGGRRGRPWSGPGALRGRSLGRCVSGRPDRMQVWATGGTWPHEAPGTVGAGRETEETSGRGMSRVGLSAEVPPQGGGRTPVPVSVLSDIPAAGDVCLCCSGTGMFSRQRWGCAVALARREWCHTGNKVPGLGWNPQVPDPWPAGSLPSTPASSRPTPAARRLCPELGGLLSGASCLSCPLGCPRCPLDVSCSLVQVS